MTIDLTNGCAYAFPAQLVQDLNGATDDQLAGIEVDGLGFNLHWPALVSGVFGTRLDDPRAGAAGWSRNLAREGRSGARQRREGRTPAQGRGRA